MLSPPYRIGAGREELNRFCEFRLGKWLGPGPESGLDWLVCSDLAQQPLKGLMRVLLRCACPGVVRIDTFLAHYGCMKSVETKTKKRGKKKKKIEKNVSDLV